MYLATCQSLGQSLINGVLNMGKGRLLELKYSKRYLQKESMECGVKETREFFEEKSSLIDEVVKRIAYVTTARFPNSHINVIKHRKI